jgi:hypothetical protein
VLRRRGSRVGRGLDDARPAGGAVRELLIRLETGEQCEQLLRFLRERDARPRLVGQGAVALDLDEAGCPSLATLVAAVEEWRGLARAGEAVLELDGERRILRSEI